MRMTHFSNLACGYDSENDSLSQNKPVVFFKCVLNRRLKQNSNLFEPKMNLRCRLRLDSLS